MDSIDGIIFLIFCFLMVYIMDLADKRYKINESLIKENMELKEKIKNLGG